MKKNSWCLGALLALLASVLLPASTLAQQVCIPYDN